MADTFQPTLSGPDTKAASFTQTPVKDTAGIEFTQNVASQAIETGVDLWKRYEKGRLLGPDTIDSPEKADLTDITVDKDTGAVTVSPTTTLNLNKIAAARKQGAISPEAARTLVVAAVKEASTRMPGMAEEFRKQAADFFGAYAPGWGLLQDEGPTAEQKMAEKYKEARYEFMKKARPDMAYMTYGSPEEQAQFDYAYENDPQVQIHKAATLYSSMSDAQKAQMALEKPQANQKATLYVADRATKVEQNLNAVLSPLGLNMDGLQNISDPAQRGQAKLAVNQWIVAELAQYNAENPNADSSNREIISSLLNDMKTSMFDAIDGKSKEVSLKQQLENYKVIQFFKLRDQAPGTIGYLTAMNQAVPGFINNGDWTTKIMGRQMVGGLGELFPKHWAFMDFSNSASPYDGSASQKGKEEYLKWGNDQVQYIESTDNKTQGWEKAEIDFLAGFVKGMDDPTNQKNITPSDYKQIFSMYTKPDWVNLKKANPELASKIEDSLAAGIDDYAVRAGKSIMAYFRDNPSSKGKIEFAVTPDGRVMFAPAKDLAVGSPEYKNFKKEADTLNNNYQFGTMAKAWSNIYQRPQGELFKELITKGYFPNLSVQGNE